MTRLEKTFRFYAWALQHPTAPSVQAIMDRFEMSRANAYRWRAAYLASLGVNSETWTRRCGKFHAEPPSVLPRRPALRLAA